MMLLQETNKELHQYSEHLQMRKQQKWTKRRRQKLENYSTRPKSHEKLKNHFEQHFTKREILIPLEIDNPQLYSNTNYEIIAVDNNPPTAVEVKKVS